MSALIAGSEGAPVVVSRPRPLTQEEVIQRLQQDRKILVAALRRIHQDAPAWEAAGIARDALDQVGAGVEP